MNRPAKFQPMRVLSAEEMAIQADEHSEAGITLDQAIDDAERITEVAEIAQDVVTVVDATPEIGPVEQDLVAYAGEMAVAGTDADPTEVISLPELDGEDLSVEGIVAALKSIWDAIITAIKNMWVGFKHWATTYFSQLEQAHRYAEELRSKLQGMKGYMPNSTGAEINVRMADIFGYGGNNSLVAMMKNIGAEDRKFCDAVITICERNGEMMNKLSPVLQQMYNSYDGSDSSLSKVTVATTGVTNVMKHYIDALGLKATGKGTYQVQIAGMTVQVNNATLNGNDEVEDQLARLGKIRFNASQSTNFDANGTIGMRPDAGPGDLLLAINARISFIEALMALKKNMPTEEDIAKVERACENMINRVSNGEKSAVNMAKRMMPLVTAFSNWATQPTNKLMIIGARHSKFWLSLVEMSMNNLQAPEGLTK